MSHQSRGRQFVGWSVRLAAVLYGVLVAGFLFLLTVFFGSEADGPGRLGVARLCLYVVPGLLALLTAVFAYRSASAYMGRSPRIVAVLGWCVIGVLLLLLWAHIVQSLRCTYFWRGFLTGSCR